MKRLFAIVVLVALAANAKADDIFATGYYVQNSRKVAAVYKNGEIIYTVHHEGMNASPKTIVCDSNMNFYWMVNLYEGTSFRYTEVWENDQLYVSTQNLSGVRIIDIYCLDDTLYYAGSYTNEGGITVASVWKGTDFTTHWQLGDGEHPSFIYDAEVNPNTGIPYFCGYVNDEKLKATVWENNETLYSHDLSYVTESSASYISIDNDSIFTLGYHEAYDYDLPVIWKNGNAIKTFDEDVMVKCLCAFQGDYYYCYTYPHEMDYCLCSNNSIVLQFPFDGSAGANKICKNDDDIYVVGLLDNKGCIWKNFEVFQQLENCDQLFDIVVFERFIEDHSEWYYEIQNDDGTITYQHLYCAGDTVVQGKRPKVIVRSNTQYDKAEHTDVTHEYVYEENGMVYWWNKDLEEFTTLYNLNAEIGDEWEIKVGNESITMHVEGVDSIEYEGRLFRVLHVSDSDDLFSGDIVCGIGHLTSFFPERLMNHNKDYRIEGLRCYWVDGELLFKYGAEDCDAIYNEIHHVNENGPSTGSGTLIVYPNPANDILFVETQNFASLPDPTYRISNLMGQTLLSGQVETRRATSLQIDVSSLPAGMYFISVGNKTMKFVVR